MPFTKWQLLICINLAVIVGPVINMNIIQYPVQKSVLLTPSTSNSTVQHFPYWWMIKEKIPGIFNGIFHTQHFKNHSKVISSVPDQMMELNSRKGTIQKTWPVFQIYALFISWTKIYHYASPVPAFTHRGQRPKWSGAQDIKKRGKRQSWLHTTWTSSQVHQLQQLPWSSVSTPQCFARVSFSIRTQSSLVTGVHGHGWVVQSSPRRSGLHRRVLLLGEAFWASFSIQQAPTAGVWTQHVLQEVFPHQTPVPHTSHSLSTHHIFLVV